MFNMSAPLCCNEGGLVVRPPRSEGPSVTCRREEQHMLPNNIAGALPSACGEADLLCCVSLQSLPPRDCDAESFFRPASARQLGICAELRNSSSSYVASPHEPPSHVVPVLNKAGVYSGFAFT